jgi:hypothetical protein
MRNNNTVTYDCVSAENEKFFYMNMKLFVAMYKRSEYKYDMKNKHSLFTARRLLSYIIRYRPHLVEKHKRLRNPLPTSSDKKVHLSSLGFTPKPRRIKCVSQACDNMGQSQCTNK